MTLENSAWLVRRFGPHQSRALSSGGCSRPRRAPPTGGAGAPTSPSASGARSARTTARTAPPGTTSRTTTRARRAYRWGEDGLGGISDNHQRLCFALALWNGRDPILKERLFGLTGPQGNHGEDVKEYYFYLDSTPTHSYMKFLYKYPQAAFPYERLVEENARRGRSEPEFELLDTGVFDEDRYFDVTVEYAKAGVDDILVRITAVNRGPEAAALHLLPTLWFRNTWDWDAGAPQAAPERLPDAAGGAADRRGAPDARPLPARGRGRARAPLRRERNQCPARLRGAPPPPASRRTGSTTTWSTGAPMP